MTTYNKEMEAAIAEYNEIKNENIMIDLQHTIFNCTRCGFRSHKKIPHHESVFYAAGDCMTKSRDEFNKIYSDKIKLEIDMLDMNKYINMHSRYNKEDQYEKNNRLNIGLKTYPDRHQWLMDMRSEIDKEIYHFSKGWWKGCLLGLIGGLLLGSMWMWIAIEVWKL